MPGEYKGMQRNSTGTYGYVCKVLVECTEIQGNNRGMHGGTKCQVNAGECQGNAWEWVQRAKGMQANAGNARRM